MRNLSKRLASLTSNDHQLANMISHSEAPQLTT